MEELKQRILRDGIGKAETLIDFCRQSGAEIIGMGFLVEKAFANGGQFLRDHHIEYHYLAKIIRINADNSLVVE